MNIQGCSVIKGGPSVECATFYSNLGWTLLSRLLTYWELYLCSYSKKFFVSAFDSIGQIGWEKENIGRGEIFSRVRLILELEMKILSDQFQFQIYDF